MPNEVTEPKHTAAGIFREIDVDAGSSAIVHVGRSRGRSTGQFRQEYEWQHSFFPGANGTVDVHHSLNDEGDGWTPARDNPYSEPTESYEVAKFSRVRFTATDDAANIHVLSPTPLDVTFV